MFPHRCSPSVPLSAGPGMTARIDAARKRSATDMAEHPVKSVIVLQGARYPFAHIEPDNTQAGVRAFGYPRALILKALHRNGARYLQC